MDERLGDAITRVQQLISDRPSDKENIREKVFKLDKLLHTKGYVAKHVEKYPSDNSVGYSQTEIERRRVHKRLKGFVVKESRAWKQICSHFGPNLNQVELKSIAEVIGQHLNIRVDREAKRRKEVLIKWFDENIDVIEPLLPRIIPVDKNGNDIVCEQ